jgi:hypothetical protein
MGNRINSTQISRTMVESISKYSAMPPHTPAILLSDIERIKRLDVREGPLVGTCSGAPQKEQKLE